MCLDANDRHIDALEMAKEEVKTFSNKQKS